MARLGLYQPFIEDRNVRRLYQLKVRFQERQGRGVPMTVLLNRILDDFFETDLERALTLPTAEQDTVTSRYSRQSALAE